MKAIAIGHSTYDTTIITDTYPIENLKYRLPSSITCSGGPASNAAYLLAKWNMDTTIASLVGNDYYGKLIKKDFDQIKANTNYFELKNKHETDSSYIIANTSNGSRTILTCKDGKKYDRLDFDIKDKYDLILVDGEHYKTAEKVLERNNQAISVLDAGRLCDETRKLGKLVTYVVCSKDFAEDFTMKDLDKIDINTLKEVHDDIASYFETNVIITLEANGSFTKIDGEYKIIPSIEVESVDATGAGDIFHGAFLYFIGNNYPLEESIKLASIAGAISVTRIGSRNSIPTLEEVLDTAGYDQLI